MAIVERVYTIPLVDAYWAKRTARAVRTMKLLRGFLARHMKVDASAVKIDESLNSFLWTGGMTKPPRKVKVKVRKGEDGKVLATLLEPEKKAEKPGEKPVPAKQKAVKGVKPKKKAAGKKSD